MEKNKDQTKSVRCIRDIREFPPESYRLPLDGRKWKSLCEERRKLALQLATYANGDGTSITAGINRWVKETGIKRRTLFRRLDDLRKLGLLRDKHGLTGESGTALRSLDVSKLRMPGEDVPEVPDRAAGVPDSTDQKCQIEQSGVPNSAPEVPHRLGGVPKPPVFGTQPSLLPSTNRPSNRSAEPVAVAKDLIGRMISIHMDAGKGILSRAGSKLLLSLPEQYGVSEEKVGRVYRYWLTHRQLEGLQHPLIKFVEEFPENLASLQAHEQREAEAVAAAAAKREANHAANLRKIAESDAAHGDWKKRFDELIEPPSMEDGGGSFWERGSEGWIDCVKDWVRLNPPPPTYSIENGELRSTRDNTTEGCIAQAVQQYADQLAEYDQENIGR